MKDAIWFLLVTAVGIPIGGWISAYINAQISRATSRETALLSASQKRRDTEIAQLRDAQSSLLEAATAVQSYVWYVDREIRLRATIDDEDWHASREFIERAVVGAQQLRALARTLPTTELSDAYIAVERLIMDVVRGSDEDDARDAWHDDVSGPQPDTISRAVNATADTIKQLYDTYPAEIGEKPSNPQITSRARTEN